jgi:hypothetical protein
MSAQAPARLWPRRGPLRLLLSADPWAGAAYLTSYLVVGTALFTVALVAVVTAAALSILAIGLPLLVAAAVVVRGCAQVERWRLGLVTRDRPAGRYREVTDRGVLGQLRTRWRDPATRRDLAYLVALFAPLLVLDVVVVGPWLSFLAGITLPLWYWSVPQPLDNGQTAHGVALGWFPDGPGGPGSWGFWIDDLGSALAAAAAFLVLLLLCNYLVVLAARVHARVARSLLGPSTDPLAAAKAVLAAPGPLS